MYSIRKTTAAGLALLGVVLCLMNGALLRQNRILKSNLAKMESEAFEQQREALVRVGQVVPPLQGKTLQGEMTLAYGEDGRDTLILVFSPHCDFCTKNVPNWRALTGAIDRSLFRVVAVSTNPEGAAEYWASAGLSAVPALTEVDPKDKVAYEMNATPITMMVGPDGRVKNVWAGVFSDEDRAQIARSTGVRLPPAAN
jgi:peroxiredoxin